MLGVSYIADDMIALEEGLCSMEFVFWLVGFCVISLMGRGLLIFPIKQPSAVR